MTRLGSGTPWGSKVPTYNLNLNPRFLGCRVTDFYKAMLTCLLGYPKAKSESPFFFGKKVPRRYPPVYHPNTPHPHPSAHVSRGHHHCLLLVTLHSFQLLQSSVCSVSNPILPLIRPDNGFSGLPGHRCPSLTYFGQPKAPSCLCASIPAALLWGRSPPSSPWSCYLQAVPQVSAQTQLPQWVHP